MKYFDWNEEKNVWLKLERSISFEEVREAIELGAILDIIDNKDKYPNQKVFIVNIRDYVYCAPYVEDNEKYFLKTIYPSRKLTKKYLLKK